jgi:hypothetical protein
MVKSAIIYLSGIALIVAVTTVASAQERAYLLRDYAWRDYYEQKHDTKALQAEEARIAQEQARLEKMGRLDKGHDYSAHKSFPPGWVGN